MRLIDTESLKLHEFFDSEIPQYAILSHTWKTKEEVSFQEMKNYDRNGDSGKQKAGFEKIIRCCHFALKRGIKWAWVDTCCIDKTSSAELTEAINSMYRWYKNSETCYVVLADVVQSDWISFYDEETIVNLFRGSSITNVVQTRGVDSVLKTAELNHQLSLITDDSDRWKTRMFHYISSQPSDTEFEFIRRILAKSRWFTRGWTLQELIAPREVVFYSSDWVAIGTRNSLLPYISNITQIEDHILRGGDPFQQSIAKRMSWASSRETSRVEDLAYCLLGLFDINMPLLYGEGEKAFIRLQEEIMKESDDQSLFAWMDDNTPNTTSTTARATHGILASHPSQFANSGNIVATEPRGESAETYDEPFSKTSRGIRIKLPVKQTCVPDVLIATLECMDQSIPSRETPHYGLLAIYIQPLWPAFEWARTKPTKRTRYVRLDPHILINHGSYRHTSKDRSSNLVSTAKIYAAPRIIIQAVEVPGIRLRISPKAEGSISIIDIYPSHLEIPCAVSRPFPGVFIAAAMSGQLQGTWHRFFLLLGITWETSLCVKFLDARTSTDTDLKKLSAEYSWLACHGVSNDILPGKDEVSWNGFSITTPLRANIGFADVLTLILGFSTDTQPEPTIP